jgi:selenocysteine lyase/cysteine desulfurase
VHFAPHAPLDVAAIGCDYLVCSGYKIFSPHMGFAYCRRDAINRLPTFREHFIPDVMPDKLEAGTYAYENVAGMDAVVDYLDDLGRGGTANTPPGASSRQQAVRAAMESIAAYERGLSASLVAAIAAVPGAVVHGVTAPEAMEARVPTVGFTVDGVDAGALAEALASADIGVRSGHMYAPRLMSGLGLADDGMIRASLVHYNTADEVNRFGGALAEAVGALRSSRPRSAAVRFAAR